MLKMLLNILKLKKKFLDFFLNLGNPLFHFIVKIIVKMKWRNNDEKTSCNFALPEPDSCARRVQQAGIPDAAAGAAAGTD